MENFFNLSITELQNRCGLILFDNLKLSLDSLMTIQCWLVVTCIAAIKFMSHLSANFAFSFSSFCEFTDTKTGRNFHCSCVVGGLVVCCPVVVCAKIAGSYIGRCPVLGKYHVDLFSCIVKACHCSQAS